VREQGLDVYGIGEKKTPEAFRMACKRFIYVENLALPAAEEPARAPVRADPAPPGNDVLAADPPARPGMKEPPARAIPLILAAMRAIDPEAEWYSLSLIGKFIMQGNPDFDARTYGSAKLSDLIKKISRFELKTGPSGQLLARDRA
jgi:hypothetical protein